MSAANYLRALLACAVFGGLLGVSSCAFDGTIKPVAAAPATGSPQTPATSPASADAEDEAAPTAGPEFVSAAKAIREASAVEAAFADIESQRERNNQWLIALNEIPAPPFREAERAADLVRRFETLGVSDVRIDEIGNVIAIRPGTVGQRTVAIVAHMDTVFPADTDVTVHRDGDVFTAPGIGDNTRGLVVMLALADALQKHDISTRDTLMFVGSVGEEGLGDLRGVRHLFGEGKRKIDSFIAIDGGQISRLVYAGVGSNRYRVTFKGPGGHSYGAFGRGHPHQALAAAIAGFTERATPITRSPGARATFSVGMIGGGTSINSIPFESWMEVDMRSTDPRRLDALDAAFKSSIDVALAEENARRTIGDALEVEVEPVGRRPAGQGERTGTLVRRAIAAIELLGGEPELEASSTDANIPIWLGVPAVTIGRGGISRNSHAPDESWEDKDSHLAIQLALLLVLLEAGEG